MKTWVIVAPHKGSLRCHPKQVGVHPAQDFDTYMESRQEIEEGLVIDGFYATEADALRGAMGWNEEEDHL